MLENIPFFNRIQNLLTWKLNAKKPDISVGKERDITSRVLILQASTDSSEGADVVKVEKNRLIVVDGTGNGVTGQRIKAEQLAQRLVETDDPLTTLGTYVALSAKDNLLSLRARAGGYVIVWNTNPQGGLFEPQVIYVGDDIHPKEVSYSLDITPIKFIMALTDGGTDFLASRNLFADRKEFSNNARKIVDAMEEDMPQEDIPDAFTRVLLRPLTAILNENKDPDSVYASLQKRFE